VAKKFLIMTKTRLLTSKMHACAYAHSYYTYMHIYMHAYIHMAKNKSMLFLLLRRETEKLLRKLDGMICCYANIYYNNLD
jgi:hypothetical protein